MNQRPRKKWEVRTPSLDKSLKLAGELRVSPLIGQLLVSRGFTNAQEAKTYLYPQFKLICPSVKDSMILLNWQICIRRLIG